MEITVRLAATHPFLPYLSPSSIGAYSQIANPSSFRYQAGEEQHNAKGMAQSNHNQAGKKKKQDAKEKKKQVKTGDAKQTFLCKTCKRSNFASSTDLNAHTNGHFGSKTVNIRNTGKNK